MFFEIISQVQSNDLKLEEARVKREQEERRLLRLASNPGTYNASELLKRLAVDLEEKATKDDGVAPEQIAPAKQEITNAKPVARFPPPPRGAK